MKSCLLLLAILASASAVSLCDYYAAALNITQLQLVTTVVQNTVVRVAVTPNDFTQQYFNGSFPPGSFDYLANTTAVSALEGRLVAFFGQQGVLSCSDPTFPAYVGPNMTYVHRNMAIEETHFDYFNDQLIAVVAQAGVTPADQASIRSILDSTRSQIVTRQQTICVKYASILNMTQYDLVSYIVGATFAAVTAVGTPTKKYFDGTLPVASDAGFNYIGNATATGALAASLVAFFGQQGVLSCDDPTFPAYTHPNMSYVHRNMGIMDSEFDFFNAQILNIAIAAGVSPADVTAIGGVLNSTRSAIVTFKVTTSPFMTSAVGALSSDAVFASVNMILLAIVAIIAAVMF